MHIRTLSQSFSLTFWCRRSWLTVKYQGFHRLQHFLHCPLFFFHPLPQLTRIWKYYPSNFFMSPLMRHIFVCFMAKSAFLGGFFGPSSVTMGLTHIALGWNMSVTLRCYATRRKPRRCIYALNLGGPGISPPDKSPPGQKTPPDSFSFRSSFRSSFRFRSKRRHILLQR